MDIVSQIAEYKIKLEALASKAALGEELTVKVEALETEKNTLTASVEEKDAALIALSEKATALETEVAALKADIESREASKLASDEKALEIVASLGLQNIPVITVTESSKPTATNIREKYLAISDPTEKGVFFNENRNAILNGIIE